ncbi:hypothetical protein ACP3PM_20575 [Pseudomonas iridis]
MALKITMNNVTIADCGGGISVGSECDELNMTGVIIERCETAIVQRDSAGALSALGIPYGTPREFVSEVIDLLRQKQTATDEEKKAAVSASRFGALMQNSANATTVIQGLVALSPALLQALQSLL